MPGLFSTVLSRKSASARLTAVALRYQVDFRVVAPVNRSTSYPARRKISFQTRRALPRLRESPPVYRLQLIRADQTARPLSVDLFAWQPVTRNARLDQRL